MSPRLAVRKTYKLYVGGAFARSESGRHDPVLDHEGSHVANITRASRKDVRDAVKAARKAQGGWAGKTAYNRGQVLYRAAEALEARSGEFAQQAVDLRGAKPAAARDEVAAAVDLLVHYAGWTDKLHAVLGGVNPVAAPFLSFSTPEPTGVVGVVAPEEPELLGLVGAIAPALAAGNAVVAICSERWPLAGLDLGEVLAVSDVPAGVVNLLAGRRAELAPALGAPRDLNAIVDASGDPELGERLDVLAAETVKRVVRIPQGSDARADALRRLEGLTELKTAWHPIGA
jgi:acyl-CoA reductase-like NAD-dependent aldehyde dehydrogenase